MWFLLATLFVVAEVVESGPLNEVYYETDGSDYRGTISTTINGRTCQEWTEQSPHSHSRTPENYPSSGLGEHSYCRNPDGVDGAWCYTTDGSVRWEYCDIGQPAENGEPSNEVYHENDGSDYRGTVSTTVNGRTCQEWTEQSPHSHSRTPENFPNSGLGEHNYCRNPDGVDGAWCYTTDDSVRWEYCDIGQPAEKREPTPSPVTEALPPKTKAPIVESSNEVYHENDGSDYRGTVSTTVNGRTCQEWTEQSPHSHSRTPVNYPNSGLGEHNFCRNPDGVDGAWCYTTDDSVRWEYCDIGQPAEKGVYHESDGSDYRGTVSTTINGRTCQEWTEQSPHSHSRTPENYPNSGLGEHNYCRNPDGVDGAWCYTTDASVRWEYCNIGQPAEKGESTPSPMTEALPPKTKAPLVESSNEVYHETDGSDYRGAVSTTINGRTCQEWTEQSPHSHSRTPVNYPNSGLGEHNFCRNPDGVDGAWCYTTDDSVRWEYCDIGQPAEKRESTPSPMTEALPPKTKAPLVESSNEVYHETDGSDYRGAVSTTVNGRTCQEWTEQSPHSHSRTPVNYPNSGLGEHNFCRNPDGVDGAWCYTTDDSVRWEYCDIGQPAEKGVYHESDGSDYRGTVSTTINGRTCQEWTEQSPHSHSRTPENYPNSGLGEHNYCRNPDGVDGAWCYTTDASVRWEYCNIGQPAEKGESTPSPMTEALPPKTKAPLVESSNEVYHETDGSDYRGAVSTTINGRTCQEWTEQSPHSHSRTPVNYPNSGLGEHNYCRNPDGVDGAWCYTTDDSVRWEYCDIGQPAEKGESTPSPMIEALPPKTKAPFVEPSNEVYHESDGSDYRGTVSTTINGRTCQEWTEQSPHSHSRTPENYPNSGLGDHNYCRNPDGVDGAWCYTTDASVRWEYCDIGQPAEKGGMYDFHSSR
ncbi:apolipoprotein(a)-like [Ptychodera flava]|uniref:apolipoprotein(a)-like n=1 Tax=Ptychodera flava TaxID=63121 RepID=UPI003969DFBB